MNDNGINKLERLEKRSKYREALLEDIVKKSEPIINFKNKKNFLVLAREWNSWYPSAFNVKGGCYFFNINREIIIIDPGFNTLEIIRQHKLDVRQIRHIFVSHFHPDHFESLITLITRLTSEKNRLTIYLNSTTFHQFKIYKSGFTEFIEIKPGISLDLKFESKSPDFLVNVKVEKAFHKEIGGAMNSIGFKFYLSNKGKQSHVIGFMSDTDGQSDYLENYVHSYEDVDILVCHLGAIHKHPNGYKHLYKDGIESLLLKDELNNKIIFIGEFGFELANEAKYKKIIQELLSFGMEYREMIQILKNTMKDKEKSKEYFKFLIEILTEKFSEFIVSIDDFSPNIEIILPFLIHGQLSENQESPSQESNFNNLKKLLRNIENHFSYNDIIDGWRLFLQTFVYGAFNPTEYLQILRNKIKQFINFSLFNDFSELISEFFSFFSDYTKNRLLKFFIKEFSKYPIMPKNKSTVNKDELENLVLSKLNDSINTNNYDLRFKGIPDCFKILFQSTPIRGFILLYFMYFILKLFIQDNKINNEREDDGRNIVCNYLRKINDNIIIPVHPSYQIHFDSDIVKIRGRNDTCNHQAIIPINDCNKNSQIKIKKKTKVTFSKLNLFGVDESCEEEGEDEFVDVIAFEKCDICNENRAKLEQQGYSEEDIDSLWEANMKDEADKIMKKVINSSSIFDIFFNLDFLRIEDSYAINYLDEDLILSEIKKYGDIDPELFLSVRVHPILLKFTKIREYALSRPILLSRNDLKKILFSFIDQENFLYFRKNEKSHYCYQIFDNDDFADLFEEIIKNLDFKNLWPLIEFFLKKIKKEKKKNEKSKMLINIKNRFVKLSYPMIEDPDKYINEYSFLEERYNIKYQIEKGNNNDLDLMANMIFKNYYNELDELKFLGYPFENYFSKFKENLQRLFKDKI